MQGMPMVATATTVARVVLRLFLSLLRLPIIKVNFSIKNLKHFFEFIAIDHLEPTTFKLPSSELNQRIQLTLNVMNSLYPGYNQLRIQESRQRKSHHIQQQRQVQSGQTQTRDGPSPTTGQKRKKR
jgi:hypothetical protein